METYEHHTPQAYELSKKQKHQIKNIASRTPVVTSGVSQKMPRAELETALNQFGYQDTFHHSGATNKRRPALLEALLGSSARDAKQMYLAGLGGVGDMVNLTRIATDAAVSGNDADSLILRMVMGATEEASFRSIGYPIPAMQMVQRLHRVGQKACLQIVFAQNISSEMNGLDQSKVREQQAKITEGIKAIRRQLETDSCMIEMSICDDTTIDTTNLDYYAECLLRTLKAEDVEALVKKGGDDNLVNSLKYAAAHYLVHDDPASELNLLSGPSIPSTGSTVDVGGLQESYFLGMRGRIAAEVGVDYKRPPFIFTRHLVPPYYLARGGDISLDECLVPDFAFDTLIRGDTAVRLDEYLSPDFNLRGRAIGSAAVHDLVFMRDAIGYPQGIDMPFPPIPYGVSLHA